MRIGKLIRRTEPVEEPKVRKGDNALDDTVYSHPAYGCIAVFRTSGHANLFGSDFRHQHYVSIEISEAELHRGLSYDRHHPGKLITRLRMSEHQWAAFVSAVGQGTGIQCTLELKPAPDAPMMECPGFPHRDENDDFAQEGRNTVAEALAVLTDLETELRSDLRGLSKTAQANALAKVERAKSKLNSSLPFVESSFLKRMEERVQKAKTEMHAWMEAFIRRRGMESIARQTGMPILIEQKEEPDGPDHQA